MNLRTPLRSHELVNEMISHLRSQFYADRKDKVFWHDRSLLLAAVTYPAKWLAARGMTREVPERRYREILMLVITTIKRRGDTRAIHSFGRYLLHCVQEHMKHHGEEYYDTAKATRSALDDVMLGLKKKLDRPIETDGTIAELARVHATLASRGGRKKKTSPALGQDDLFGSCTAAARPMQRP